MSNRVEQPDKASDSVLKPILIGFLVGFSLMGASRLASAPAASAPASPALALSSASMELNRLRDAAMDFVSVRKACDRKGRRLRILI
jgi:hypothetical protein